MLVWLDREMEWLASPSEGPGRAETFSDVAVQFCLSLRVLFGLGLRQTIGMVASLLKMAGSTGRSGLARLAWPVPDYSTLCRRQSTVAIEIPFRRSDSNLNPLVGTSE
jgi:hypothetical protein